MAGVKAAYANARPPKEVHQAFVLMLIYMGISLVGGILRLILPIALVSGATGYAGFGIGFGIVFLIISLIVYAAITYVGVMMRAGRQWARITIAVLAGLGALSALFGVFGALGFGVDIVFLIVSLLQLAAAAGVLILIFRPNVNSYFT